MTKSSNKLEYKKDRQLTVRFHPDVFEMFREYCYQNRVEMGSTVYNMVRKTLKLKPIKPGEEKE